MAVVEKTERERKYDGDARMVLPPLDTLPRVAAVRAAPAHELDAVYYDTADLRLLRQGVTLRRRTGGDDAGWHLKLPGHGPDDRVEIHAPIDAADPGEVPALLAARVRARARGGRLLPVADLRTHRSRQLLVGARGQTLAEIARDEVAAHVLGVERLAVGGPRGDARRGSPAKRAGTSTQLTTWTEVEVELVDGGRSLLDAVDRRMVSAGLARSASPSKLAHALHGLAAPARAPRKPAKRSIEAAVVRRLREQADALLALDPAVRADEPDAVHQMRVAVRRLRSALRTYRGVLDPMAAGKLGDELGWLGRTLGRARDTEVIGALLRARADALPDVLPGIATWSAEEYHAAWTEAVAQLGSPRYYALLDLLESVLTDPPSGPRAGRGAAKSLRKAMAREARRAESKLADARAARPGPERDTAWHDARKAAKRARYAGEGAAPVLGEPAKRFARRAKRLQQVLGERQDAVTARRVLPEIAGRAFREGRDTFGYTVLYIDLERAVAQAEDRLARH